MIKHLLCAACVMLSATGINASVPRADGDSIVPSGDAKYETGVYYRITSLNFNTLALAGFIKGQDRETIVVPSKVLDSISGITYTVTSVADDAFNGKTILKNVTLPNTITRIGNRAFKSCSIESAVIPGSNYHVMTEAYANNPLKEVRIYSPGVEGAPEIDHSVELQNNAFGQTSGNMTDVYITYKNPPIVMDGEVPFPQEAARHHSAILHLSDGADEQAYRNAYCWKDFFAELPTGVDELTDDSSSPKEYYTLTGTRVSADRGSLHGIYIVRCAGKAHKVIIP